MSDTITQDMPDAARSRLVDQLVAAGRVTDLAVEAAFRAVPRHLFAPAGTSVQDAYADDIVVTRRGADGKATSSISAPWLQAYMLQTARLRPGQRVLEIGSGGYNAALIAEIVGPTGTVTSIDIDTTVVTNARAALDAAGYPQVKIVEADAEYGHPDGAPYDAIIVTVNAADLPPAWTEQLTTDGVLVVPLRMRGHTRCLTLRRHDDHLVATAATQCGFVAMQGAGSHPPRRIPLRGDDAVLLLDDDTEADATALTAALDQPRVELWTAVTAGINDGAAFESVQLWLASQPRPYGVLTVDRERTARLLDPQDKFTCPTMLTDRSIAYLTIRKHDNETWQFGAHGFGPDAVALTHDLAGLLTAWDQQQRGGTGAAITVHPAGTSLPDTDRQRLLVQRRHTTTAITWPAPGGAR